MTEDLTREQLHEKYGTPESVSRDRIREMIRLTGAVCTDTNDAFAFRYPSTEAAEAFADANQRHHGHTSYGPVTLEDGVYGVLVLNPAAVPVGPRFIGGS